MTDDCLIRGLAVSARSFAETVDLLATWTELRGPSRFFACINAHSVETAHADRNFFAALRAADLLVADGYGVILASRILGRPIGERSTGPDLFTALSRRLDSQGGRSVFYLGGSPETLRRIHTQHRQVFPRLRVAGSFAPPFRAAFSPAELDDMIESINAASPDVLWVGLGAPKQEKWIHANASRLRVPLCGPIGAMFDYFAGTITRPPGWVERAGLHWAFRLAQEPRRLWRRNLDSPLFLSRVLAERLRLVFRGIRQPSGNPSDGCRISDR